MIVIFKSKNNNVNAYLCKRSRKLNIKDAKHFPFIVDDDDDDDTVEILTRFVLYKPPYTIADREKGDFILFSIRFFILFFFAKAKETCSKQKIK